jgi:hypothetical protein
MDRYPFGLPMTHVPRPELSLGARLLIAPMLAVALLWTVAGAVAAHVESTDGNDARSKPAPPTIGYDISYPQCGGPYPANPAFGIVGVNRGIVFSANPCLGAGSGASQLAWAGPNAQLYANTGNPGPQLSSHWPNGQTAPRECATAAEPDPDTVDCAYDYGWNAAADSYAKAVAAYVSLGWADPGSIRTPVANHWWLDVETANSWRDDQSLNVAALEGAVDYLASAGAVSVGIYSSPRMWSQVVGGSSAFATLPSWVAGASTLKGATNGCGGPGLTGGAIQLTQYIRNGFDADHPC